MIHTSRQLKAFVRSIAKSMSDWVLGRPVPTRHEKVPSRFRVGPQPKVYPM